MAQNGQTSVQTSQPREARSSVSFPSPDGRNPESPLSAELLRKMDAYWRAANYLSVGQIYLFDNPLLKEPLQLKHIKPRLLGHWGTTPGLNFIYVHLNRVIKEFDLSVVYVAGPGHGAGRAWSPTPTWRALTARCTRTSGRTRPDSSACSPSSRFPGRSRTPECSRTNACLPSTTTRRERGSSGL